METRTKSLFMLSGIVSFLVFLPGCFEGLKKSIGKKRVDKFRKDPEYRKQVKKKTKKRVTKKVQEIRKDPKKFKDNVRKKVKKARQNPEATKKKRQKQREFVRDILE